MQFLSKLHLSNAQIQTIREEHGDEVGYYFAFLSHYIACLIPLGLAGLFVFVTLMLAR